MRFYKINAIFPAKRRKFGVFDVIFWRNVTYDVVPTKFFESHHSTRTIPQLILKISSSSFKPFRSYSLFFFELQSYPVISTSLISTSRYLDINLRSRQKQSLFNIKLPGYLDISISTTRYLDIISNPLEEKLDIWYFRIYKTCEIEKKTSKFTKDFSCVIYLYSLYIFLKILLIFLVIFLY